MKELADEHWAFLVKWLEMVYKDGFIHGYKHGEESHIKVLIQADKDAKKEFERCLDNMSKAPREWK